MYCGMAPNQCFSSGKRLVLVLPEVDRKCNGNESKDHIQAKRASHKTD